MADFSTTYAIDNSKEFDVLCHYDGMRRVVVQENTDSSNPPTADLLQRGALPSSTQVRVNKGTPAIFTAPDGGFRAGEKVGTIQTASGSITVAQLESLRI